MSKKEQLAENGNMAELGNALLQIELTFRSKKAGVDETAALAELPLSSIEAVIRYGAQRFINDKLGGSEVGEAEAKEKFAEIMAQLREGWIDRRGTGGGASPVDPVEKEALGMARERVKAVLRAKGIKQKDLGPEKVAELSQAMLEKDRENLMEAARRTVEMRNQTLDLGGLDLGDLGL